MGVAIFYPWLRLQSKAAVAQFELLPWRREDPSPGHWSSGEQAVLDSLLASFLTQSKHPIQCATIVKVGGFGVVDDLPDDVIADFAEVREVIAFSGLATREFFSFGGYSNTANLTPIIQRFTDADSGVLVRSRRRDGTNSNYTSRELQLEFQPPHALVHSGVQVDETLCAALQKSASDNKWEPYGLSLPLFNLANTDSNLMSERVEVVLTVSAFERLLEAKPKATELVDHFGREFSVSKDVNRSKFARIPPQRFAKRSRVREVWMEDLFALRGSLAHGHHDASYPALWSLHEHLLLAALAFPLLVKLRLSSDGYYTLTQTDRAAIDAFEHLVGHNNLFDEGNGDAWPWRELLSHFTWFAP